MVAPAERLDLSTISGDQGKPIAFCSLEESAPLVTLCM
jgi:hypothetical protein